MRDSRGIGNGFARRVEDNPPRIDAHNAIGNTLQIGGDVTGKQHATFAVAHKLLQHIENLIAGQRVEARCRFIEKQQVSAMRKRYRDLKLHTHTARKLLHLRLRVYVEPLDKAIEQRIAPLRERWPQACHHLADAQLRRKRAGVEHHADTSANAALDLVRRIGSERFTEQLDLACADVLQAQGHAGHRSFARPVRADEADDFARGNGKVHVAQCERVAQIATHVPYVQKIRHEASPFPCYSDSPSAIKSSISCSSARETPRSKA